MKLYYEPEHSTLVVRTSEETIDRTVELLLSDPRPEWVEDMCQWCDDDNEAAPDLRDRVADVLLAYGLAAHQLSGTDDVARITLLAESTLHHDDDPETVTATEASE